MKKSYSIAILLLVIIIVAALLRIPGLKSTYYQDEYKWAQIVAKGSPMAGILPHPPLSEKIFVTTDRLFGNDNLRLTPFIFSLINILMIFFVVKLVFDRRTALVSAGLFAISYYSILASNMVDTDGQILPFLFLAASYAYLRWMKGARHIWLVVAIVSVALGFLTKMSFIIPALALVIDFLWAHSNKISKKFVLMTAGSLVVIGGLLVIILLNASKIFPSFNLSSAVEYWEHFMVFSNRNWGQTFIQLAKSVLYLSPLLILPVFLTTKEIFKKARLFYIFSVIGLLFYLVAFDFSLGALDRYFQFLIVPLCIIAGAVFVKILDKEERVPRFAVLLAVIFAVGILLLQFIPHIVFPLHPKSAWIGRALSLQWNFVFPFSGGSGPLGFYMSWLFMTLSWLVMAGLVIFALVKSKYQKVLMVLFVALGVSYNLMFTEEYLVGAVNGRTRVLLADSLAYIKNNPEITKVTTYNDIGGFELMKMDKYRKRLYIDPKFDVNEKVKNLNAYKEHYLVINIPELESDTVYKRYFDSCTPVFKEKSGQITATVLDCRNIPDVKI